MNAVKFSEKEMRFLNYMRVGRLATMDGEVIHLVPICPVFDGGVFYMATHGKTRKVRNLRENKTATLPIDQFPEDGMRHVAMRMTGPVGSSEQGGDFDKAKTLLQAKFLQYNDLFAIKQGESVILRFNPTRAVTWDYIAGELNEPH